MNEFWSMLRDYPISTIIVLLIVCQTAIYVLGTAFKALGGGYVHTQCDDCNDSDGPEDE